MTRRVGIARDQERDGFASATRYQNRSSIAVAALLPFIFAFVRWTSNDFAPALSCIDILRAVAPGQRYSTVP